MEERKKVEVGEEKPGIEPTTSRARDHDTCVVLP